MKTDDSKKHSTSKFVNTVIDTKNDPVFVKDSDHNWILVNDAFCKFIGYKRKELIGKSDYEFFSKEQADIFWKKDDEVFKSGTVNVNEELFTDSKGVTKTLSTTKILSVDDSGNKILIGIIKDITENKKIRDLVMTQTAAIESSMDGIAILDKNNEYIYLNEAHAKIYGYNSAKELLGKSWKILYTPEDLKLFEQNIMPELFKAKRWMGDARGKKVDGSTFPQEISLTALADGGLICIVRDVTERKKSEEKLKENELQFRQMFESIKSCVTIYEVKDNGNNFIIKDFNPAAEKIERVKREKLIGKSVLEVFPGVKKFGLLEVFARVWKTGKPEVHPVTLYEDDELSSWRENYVYKLPNGNIVAIYEDVTERKKTEEELKNKEAQLSNALKVGLLGSWEYDFIKDLFTFSDSFYAIFHTTAEKVGGYKMSSADYAKRFVYPDDVALVGVEIQKSIDTTDPDYICRIEHRIIYADGEIGHIKVLFSIIKDDQGRTVKSYGVNQDITARKKTEEELQNSKDLLNRVINLLPIRIFWKDTDLVYLGCNTVFAKDAGKNSPEELIGKDDFQMGWKNQAELYRTDDQKVIDSGTSKINFEEPQTTPNGDKMWLRTSKIPLTDTAGNMIGILGTYEDITDRKIAEEKRIQEQKINNTIIKSIPGAFYMLDKTGKYVRWNEYQRDILVGKPEDQMNKVYAIDTIHPDDRELIQSKINNVLLHNQAESVECRVLLHGGPEYVWFIVTGQQIVINGEPFLIGMGMDTTESKKNVTALIKSENRFRALFEGSADAIMTLEPPSWSFTSGNPATVKMFKAKDEQDFLLHAPWTLSPEKQSDGRLSGEKAKEMIEKAMCEGSVLFDWIHRRINGEDFHAIVQLTRIDLPEKTFLQAIVRDITDRKKSEEELLKSTQESEKLNSFAVDRELKMIELKKEINELEKKLGQKPKYVITSNEKI